MRSTLISLFLATTALEVSAAPRWRRDDAIARRAAASATVCPGPKYYSTTKNACVPCLDIGAATCGPDGTSTSCIDATLFLESGKCAKCPTGKYGDSVTKACKTCASVDKNALTCTDKAILTCATGFSLENNRCVAACSQGSSVNGVCTSCATSFPGSTACTSTGATACDKSTYLNQVTGRCVTTCPSNTVADNSNRKCKPCTEVTPFATTCNPGAALSCDQTQVFKFLQGGRCRDKCDSRYYPDASNVCQKCTDADALVCPNNVPSQCATLFLQVLESDASGKPTRAACQAACNAHTYSGNDKVCRACDASANTCTGPAANNALSCYALDATHDKPFLQGTTCKTVCDAGFYGDANSVCQACDSSAKTCTGPAANNALSCYLDGSKPFLQGTTCQESCNAHTYSGDDKICQACDASANTCNGPAADNALSCYLDGSKPFLQDSTCQESCNAHTYSGDDKICHACDASANTCNGPAADNALSCYLDGSKPFLQDSTCQESCNAHTYSGDDKICHACDASANTCNGPAADNALSCYLDGSKPFLQDSTCQESCNAHTYSGDDKICHACDASANTCNGPAADNALSCYLDGSKPFLQDSTCQESCNAHTYSGDDKICHACDASANTCNGPAADNALSCYLDGSKPFLQDSTCQESCNAHTYSGDDKICHACDASANTCNGPAADNALSCYLDGSKPFLQDSTCQESCNAHTYSGDDKICHACDASANTCNGPAANNALSCYLDGSKPFLQDSTCQESCNAHTYSGDDRICHACDASANTCNGPAANNALSCYALDASHDKPFLQGTICKTACDAGSYADANNVCQACDPSAQTCSGAGPNAALSCYAVDASHDKPFLQGTTCKTACDAGSFADANKVCQACDPSAKTCTGPAANNALSCYALDATHNKPFLQGTTCKTACDAGSFADANKVCQACDPSAKTCSGPGPNAALSCYASDATHTKPFLQGSTCKSTCDAGYAASAGVCLVCGPNRLTRLDNNGNTCSDVPASSLWSLIPGYSFDINSGTNSNFFASSTPGKKHGACALLCNTRNPSTEFTFGTSKANDDKCTCVFGSSATPTRLNVQAGGTGSKVAAMVKGKCSDAIATAPTDQKAAALAACIPVYIDGTLARRLSDNSNVDELYN